MLKISASQLEDCAYAWGDHVIEKDIETFQLFFSVSSKGYFKFRSRQVDMVLFFFCFPSGVKQVSHFVFRDVKNLHLFHNQACLSLHPLKYHLLSVNVFTDNERTGLAWDHLSQACQENGVFKIRGVALFCMLLSLYEVEFAFLYWRHNGEYVCAKDDGFLYYLSAYRVPRDGTEFVYNAGLQTWYRYNSEQLLRLLPIVTSYYCGGVKHEQLKGFGRYCSTRCSDSYPALRSLSTYWSVCGLSDLLQLRRLPIRH